MMTTTLQTLCNENLPGFEVTYDFDLGLYELKNESGKIIYRGQSPEITTMILSLAQATDD